MAATEESAERAGQPQAESGHVPFISPLTKSAVTVRETARIPELTAAALEEALAQPSGPTFVDYPLDVVFSEADAQPPSPGSPPPARAAEGVEEAAELLAEARRPAIMAGGAPPWAPRA